MKRTRMRQTSEPRRDMFDVGVGERCGTFTVVVVDWIGARARASNAA